MLRTDRMDADGIFCHGWMFIGFPAFTLRIVQRDPLASTCSGTSSALNAAGSGGMGMLIHSLIPHGVCTWADTGSSPSFLYPVRCLSHPPVHRGRSCRSIRMAAAPRPHAPNNLRPSMAPRRCDSPPGILRVPFSSSCFTRYLTRYRAAAEPFDSPPLGFALFLSSSNL